MQPSAVNEKQRTLQSHLSGWPLWITLFILVGGGTVLRLLCLACKPFWFDEAFSVEVARIGWRNFLHLMWWREANMSLYYILLRIWLNFGQRPFFIRSLSVLFSVAALPAIYWVARLLYNRRIAMIATALLAFNAYSVRYAQETRSYSLFLLLATLSSGFLIAFLKNPSRRNWRGYVTISILALYSHLYALLLIVAHWIFTRWIYTPSDESQARSLARAWKVIGVAALPLLVFVAKTGAGPIRWIQRPGFGDVGDFFKHLSGSNSWPLALLYVLACLGAIIAAGKALWTRDRNWNTLSVQFLLLWLLFPVCLTVLLSFARPVFLPRYMIFCLPALLILASAGIARLQAWLIAPVVALFLLLGFQGISYVYAHDYDTERDASGAATNFILDYSQPGDAILFHIAETRIPYEFFRSLQAGTNTASPGFTALGPEIVFPHHGAGLDYRDFTGKPTADLVRSAAQEHPRFWLMLMNNGTAENPDSTTQMLSQVFSEFYPKMERWHFNRVEVRLYSRE